MTSVRMAIYLVACFNLTGFPDLARSRRAFANNMGLC